MGDLTEAVRVLLALIDTFHPPLAETYPGLRTTLDHLRQLVPPLAPAIATASEPAEDDLFEATRKHMKIAKAVREFLGTEPAPEPAAPAVLPGPRPCWSCWRGTSDGGGPYRCQLLDGHTGCHEWKGIIPGGTSSASWSDRSPGVYECAPKDPAPAPPTKEPEPAAPNKREE